MKKAKKLLNRTVKFALAVCIILVTGLVICGIPLGNIKKLLKSKQKSV